MSIYKSISWVRVYCLFAKNLLAPCGKSSRSVRLCGKTETETRDGGSSYIIMMSISALAVMGSSRNGYFMVVT